VAVTILTEIKFGLIALVDSVTKIMKSAVTCEYCLFIFDDWPILVKNYHTSPVHSDGQNFCRTGSDAAESLRLIIPVTLVQGWAFLLQHLTMDADKNHRLQILVCIQHLPAPVQSALLPISMVELTLFVDRA